MSKDLNSCVMLACALHTPVDLVCLFSGGDLKDTGVEIDSHITLLYAAGKNIPKDDIMPIVEKSLGGEGFKKFCEILKEDNYFKVSDYFVLDKFENDSDYLILKLRKDSKIYPYLEEINKELRKVLGVASEYTYTPHITLAELKPGTVDKYLRDECFLNAIRASRIGFEDIIISYGPSGEPKDREVFNLTTFHAVTRYFREDSIRKSSKEFED